LKKSLVTFVGGLCVAALLVSAAAQAASSVTIKNKSDWVIMEFYLAPADTDEWGPDQLGEGVIGTGDTFTVTDVPCDSYDVRLVDEAEDVCIVTEVDICADGGWVISNDDLIDCAEATNQDE
jgi:hypothetical protein